MCTMLFLSEGWHNYSHTLLWKSTTVTISGRPENKQNHCGTGEECKCEELRLRRGSSLACRAMCFASSSIILKIKQLVIGPASTISEVSYYYLIFFTKGCGALKNRRGGELFRAVYEILKGRCL